MVGSGGMVAVPVVVLVAVAVDVAVVVAVLLGVAVGTAVGGTAPIGGRKMTWPACKLVLLRQLAFKMAAMVVPERRARRNIVSPRCTVYCRQVDGGPQGGVGAGGAAGLGR